MELITQFLDIRAREEIYLAIGEIKPSTDGETALLTSAERLEYESITHSDRKDEFVSTRELIYMLSKHIGLNPDRLKIKKNELGKPFGVYERQRFYLSIAHSRPRILCGISDERDIGVDLEPVGRPVHDRLRNRIFHPEEIKMLNYIAPIRLWTIKEALVKLSGSGLRTNLNEINVAHEEENYFSVIFNNEKTARICSFEYSNYWISVAYFI